MADSMGLIKENMPAEPLCYLRPVGLVGQWRALA